jgi:hypothetical protein
MTRRASTIAVASANGMTPGTILRIGAGASAETVKVRAISGAGPYTLDVSPPTRWERLRMWLYRQWRRAVNPITRPVRGFWWSRCDKPGCWRPETGRGYCWKHAHLEDD